MKKNNKENSVLNDINKTTTGISGVIAFVSLFSSSIAPYLKLDPLLVSGVGLLMAVLVLFVGWLISKSEKRQSADLAVNKQEVDDKIDKLQTSIDYLCDITEQNRLDTLRNTLIVYINDQPENHDTILRVAQRYFVEMGGNWIMTDEFYKWVESESKLGREVRIPSDLACKVKDEYNKTNML